MSLLKEIENRRHTLSRAEEQVATWLLANARESAHLAIAEVAARAGVSEPTVIRFCRTLGMSGFRDFRAQLIRSLHEPETYLHRDVTAADSARDATGKVLDSCIRALVEAGQQIGELPLEEAVELMAAARQLLFCGVGASGHVARDAHHKFFRLGLPCSTATDAQTILQQAAIAAPEDLFLAISHTGGWSEMVTAMTTARERGSAVIAVTRPGSPLAGVASCALALPTREDTGTYTPMSSRLVHLALLDGLQVALALRLGRDAEERLRQSKEVLRRRQSEPLPDAGAP